MSGQTQHQQLAVRATGNVLVVAGAGAGKTSTLVQRCLHFLFHETAPVSLEEILMVTFTDAAAAEMRQRIREALEARLKIQPKDQRLEEQLALLDTANIGTLHGFCLRLVRQHFHELALDPQLKVLSTEEAAQLAAETLDDLLQEHYRGGNDTALAVQRLIQEQANGWDQKIRELVLQLHHYAQTLQDPHGWLEGQAAAFAQPEPVQWRAWLHQYLEEWREHWLAVLQAQPPENPAQACARMLTAIASTASREDNARAVAQIVERGGDIHWPRGTKEKYFRPIKHFFGEAAFLNSLLEIRQGVDPLTQDWDWSRPGLLTLLGLVREFGAKFSAAKRGLAALDFHDFEQMTLQLLWGEGRQELTPLAKHWRERLKLVFVDEYQDINAAQDAILRALSREGAAANRFLVGDVKQSIYRFRLADPRIFQEYNRTWRAEHSGGTVIPLSENFRSHEGLLEFINPLFAAHMRPEIGGVAYDQEARLQFGDRAGRAALTIAQDLQPRVEVILRLTAARGGHEPAEEPAEPTLAEMTKAEAEAQLIGRRLKALHDTGHLVWDKTLRAQRPVKWSDMAVLLRAVRGKAETYAKVFHRLGVPLQAARSGFFDCIEVSDVLSLLTLLDNPLQDVPLLAVLRSPFVGLTVDELAQIRLAGRKMPYWQALELWHRTQNGGGGALFATVDRFLQRYRRWRRLARRASLSQQIEIILSETDFLEWLAGRPRGVQATANVQQLLALARQFDQFQQQGLYRFLKLVEAEREAESSREPAPMESDNAVRLTSIHQSKGLEYPVVVVGDLAKRFNRADTRSTVLLDEAFGLCALVKPPNSTQQYPSLPWWLAERRQSRESQGEELRLLYVAMTRARDTLILAGTAATSTAVNQWPKQTDAAPSVHQILKATCYLDWVGPWLCQATGDPQWAAQDTGTARGIRWTVYHDQTAAGERPAELALPLPEVPPPAAPEPADLAALKHRLSWQYGFAEATLEPAKTSVSAWRRRWRQDEESREIFRPAAVQRLVRQNQAAAGLRAVEVGTAHHLFFQLVALDQVTSLAALEAEGQRLQAAGLLSPEAAAALDFPALLAFWQSPLGRRIQAAVGQVHRELPFTTRLGAEDFFRVAGRPAGDVAREGLQDEFVVVQGAVDLAVITPAEILVVDFKTDAIARGELEARVAYHEPQLRLYALALENIYQRKVSGLWLHFLALHQSVKLQ